MQVVFLFHKCLTHLKLPESELSDQAKYTIKHVSISFVPFRPVAVHVASLGTPQQVEKEGHTFMRTKTFYGNNMFKQMKNKVGIYGIAISFVQCMTSYMALEKIHFIFNCSQNAVC